MGRKLGGGCVPFGARELGLHLTMSPGPRPTSVPRGILIHPAVWSQYTWAENWVGVRPFRGGGARSPSNTMSPRLRPTSVPSDILIHTAVWLSLIHI